MNISWQEILEDGDKGTKVSETADFSVAGVSLSGQQSRIQGCIPCMCKIFFY